MVRADILLSTKVSVFSLLKEGFMRFLARLFLITLLLLAVGNSLPAVPALSKPTAGGAQAQVTRTVYVTRTGAKYHRDGCRYLSRSKISMSFKDAQAKGYTACKVCQP